MIRAIGLQMMDVLDSGELAAKVGAAAAALPGGRAEAAVMFVCARDCAVVPDLARAVRDASGARAVFGATATGLIGVGGESEAREGVSVALIGPAGIQAATALLRGEDPSACLQQLHAEIPALQKTRGVLLVAGGPAGVFPEFLAQFHQRHPEIPVVGAAAGTIDQTQAPRMICDDEILDNGISALYLTGTFEPVIGVAHSVLPVAPPARIDAVDRNSILMLDGAPAADKAMEMIEAAGGEGAGKGANDLFCILADSESDFNRGQYVVRQLIGVDPARGSISIGDYPVAGQVLTLGRRDARMARRTMRQMLERMSASHQNREPRAIFVFDCCARGKALYGRTGVDLDTVLEFFPEIPACGMFGFAEVGPVKWERNGVKPALMNYTAVIFILSEPYEMLESA